MLKMIFNYLFVSAIGIYPMWTGLAPQNGTKLMDTKPKFHILSECSDLELEKLIKHLADLRYIAVNKQDFDEALDLRNRGDKVRREQRRRKIRA